MTHSFKGKDNPNYRTGYLVKGADRQFYNSWLNMKARCLNPKHPKHHRYGGRGIKICSEWLSIVGFAQWALASGWQKGLTLDRIDNDGNYEAGNCWWVSSASNSRKKSTTRLSWEQAQTIRQAALSGASERDLARQYGVCHGTIWHITNDVTHVADGECTKALEKIGKK